jgi:nicotinamide mononucleotide transporter
LNNFLQGLLATTWLEGIAVFTGIASVWYSKKENILVYPIGLINTVIYIYLSYKGKLFGEATVNLYYSVMSIYGWLIWMKKDNANQQILSISYSTKKEWLIQLFFFGTCYIVLFLAIGYLKKTFAPGAIPWADAFASAAAFTGMWLMTRKKMENWLWWIVTNIACIPLYYVKGYVFTSVFYAVLLVLAIWGWFEWKQKLATTPVIVLQQ